MPEDDEMSTPAMCKDRERLEYRYAWDWVSVSNMSVSARRRSRSLTTFLESHEERVDAPTTHNGYGVCGVCRRAGVLVP